MSKKKVLIVAALLVAGGAAIAVSAPGQRLQDRMMDRWGHGGGPGGGLGMGPGMGGFGGHWRGELTRNSFDEKVRERFARFDTNSDGVIDVAEKSRLRWPRLPRNIAVSAIAEPTGTAPIRKVRSRPAVRSPSPQFLDDIRHRFALADLDGDGKITDADLPPTMRGRGVLTGERGFGRGGPGGPG